MPYIETIDDLVGSLADTLGIYNQRRRFHGLSVAESRARVEKSPDSGSDYDHANDCGCRMCWCARMARRMRAAVANEERLASITQKETPC